MKKKKNFLKYWIHRMIEKYAHALQGKHSYPTLKKRSLRRRKWKHMDINIFFVCIFAGCQELASLVIWYTTYNQAKKDWLESAMEEVEPQQSLLRSYNWVWKGQAKIVSCYRYPRHPEVHLQEVVEFRPQRTNGNLPATKAGLSTLPHLVEVSSSDTHLPSLLPSI